MRLQLPSSRKEWLKTILVFVILFGVVSVFIGAPYIGWWPAYGRSAWPTMKWWTFPPYHSGYYHVDYDNKNPEPGNIVWFKVPGSKWWDPSTWPLSEVKRVEKVEIRNGKPQMWVTADNYGLSGEGSDFSDVYDWIPTNKVIGVVNSIWTPTRWNRSQTSAGRFRNLIEFRFSPKFYDFYEKRIELKHGQKEKIMIFDREGSFIEYKKPLIPPAKPATITLDKKKIYLSRRDTLMLTNTAGSSNFIQVHGDVSQFYNPGKLILICIDAEDPINEQCYCVIVEVIRTEVIDPFWCAPGGATKIFLATYDHNFSDLGRVGVVDKIIPQD